MNRRFAILGTSVSSQNRGVLALGTSLINLCNEGVDPVDIVLMLSHDNNLPMPSRISGRSRLVPVVNCRLSPLSRPCDHLLWIALAALFYRLTPLAPLRRILSRSTPWIAALESSDMVGDVRGGDSFSDIYGMFRFLHGFLMAWTVLLVKGTIVQFPQTYGPYRSLVARSMARYLMKKSSVVIARDEQSQRVAQELLGPGREVWLSPDVAFSLESIRPDRLELDPPVNDSVPPGVIGLNVNGLMYSGGYTRNNMFGLKLDYRHWLPCLVEALMSEHPGELWLIPHTFAPPGSVESDPEACRQLRSELPESLRTSVRMVTCEYDQHEIKGVIGLCDFFIGSRMHACIAALSQGVPCVGVAYSMKFEGVFESVGMQGWVVDAREVTDAQATARITELYRCRDSVRPMLAEKADEARVRLREIFARLIQ